MADPGGNPIAVALNMLPKYVASTQGAGSTAAVCFE
jgi:hypothetical protein